MSCADVLGHDQILLSFDNLLHFLVHAFVFKCLFISQHLLLDVSLDRLNLLLLGQQSDSIE